MPWNPTSAPDQKHCFITAAQQPGATLKEVCARFGITPKTGRKWLRRLEAEGEKGLAERSRAAHTHPNALPAAAARKLLARRALHPSWGPKKLVNAGKRSEADLPLCAPSTAGKLLREHGLSEPRRLTRKSPPNGAPLTEPVRVNQVWSVDFKGGFRLGSGERCTPLTITDNFSRYILCCQGMRETSLALVRRQLERVFGEYGMPEVIRSDNGAPFAGVGVLGLSALGVWLIKCGIRPERIAPGCPQQNGRHERMHGTLKQETAAPPKATARAQQRRFGVWRWEFNEQRPHEALGQRTPGSLYVPSARKYPCELLKPEYLAEEETRKVQKHGEFYLKSRTVFLSEAFAGETVGLRAGAEPGVWQVRFLHLALGWVQEKEGRMHCPKPGKAAMAAEVAEGSGMPG